MKLRALTVRNFGCLDERGFEIQVDDIVVLIGPNNVGKSSILEAYCAAATAGSVLPLRVFRDEKVANEVSVEAVFVALSEQDTETLGAKWVFRDGRFGECIRVRWVWARPDAKASKESWDPAKSSWVAGGMGGWDTLIVSRVPYPIRVGPTDSPEESEAQIVEILTSAAKAALKGDATRAEDVRQKLVELTQELASEVGDEIGRAIGRAGERLAEVFPGYSVIFEPDVAKFEPERIIGGGSFVRIKAPGSEAVPLSRQGAGTRRTFLWSALGALADLGKLKAGKSAISAERPRILLLEEPESFLHPPMIRAAREALYSLANLAEWQVLVTTHSPIFIDVSKPHTTIVRIARGQQGPQVFSTDAAGFSKEERENLLMVRQCHPTVSEFFFADLVWLVEGETERGVLLALLEECDDPRARTISVVNCLGKANLVTFGKILRQFGTPFAFVHDCDEMQVERAGKWQQNSMWTMNDRIVEFLEDALRSGHTCMGCVHLPDFERQYFGEAISRDKPYEAMRRLRNLTSSQPDHELVRLAEGLLTGTHQGVYRSHSEFSRRVSEWIEAARPEPTEAWSAARLHN